MDSKLSQDKKTQIEKRFDRLANLYYAYSDEIPTEVIHSTHADRNYKVRGGWWQAVLVEFEILERDDLLPRESTYKAIIFDHKKCVENYEESKGLTSPEHIARMNRVIYQTLEHLVQIAI